MLGETKFSLEYPIREFIRHKLEIEDEEGRLWLESQISYKGRMVERIWETLYFITSQFCIHYIVTIQHFITSQFCIY